MITYKLWKKAPGLADEEPVIDYYPAENKTTDAAIIVFPGGGYWFRAPEEGEGYAKYLNTLGMDAFVLQYRVSPHHFPIQLADARRGIRFVRSKAVEFGINPDKIGVMGSSAGGHLAALLSTYRKETELEGDDEIDSLNCIPNFQVLCYPVVCVSDFLITHIGTALNLTGTEEMAVSALKYLDPALIADEKTPKAFIWHTSDDDGVNVCNSLKYAEKLKSLDIKFEMHIFPEGVHGLGLAEGNPYIAQWKTLFENWLKEIGCLR